MNNNDIELIVTQIKDISSKRRLIYINYEPAFALYNSEIKKYNIKPENTISQHIIEQIETEILYKRALIKTVNLLKSKDYTKYELENKLKQLYYSENAISNAVSYAIENKYIDDRRYAQNYVNFKSSSKSKYQIVQFLKNKGIDKKIIEDCCEEFYSENNNAELELLESQIRKLNLSITSYEEKCRVINKFYRKGFSVETIKKALDIVVASMDNN